MSGRAELEKAHYIKRLLEKKLAKTDPELDYEDRMAQAIAALHEALPPDCEPAEELQEEAEEEGLGEPPMEFDEDEAEKKVRKHKKPEPTIFVIVQEKLTKDVK